MSSFLLSLYPSILVPILFEWSTDEDLCYLDTAVCSETHREGVLSLMSLGKILKTNTDFRESCAWNTWVHLRLSRHSMASLHYRRDRFELNGCDMDNLAFFSSTKNETALDEIIRSGVALDYLRLTGAVNKMTETLNKYGHLITSLWCGDWSDFPDEKVAKLCPNLKELTSLHDVSMCSIIHKCSLDFIGHCNIAALKGSKDRWNYYCDLQRTTDCTDETTVCLGEDKYYHMTALYCRDLSVEDRSTLTPLLSHVKSARLSAEEDNLWLTENCHNLTYLQVWWPSDNGSEILLALRHCKHLKTLWLDNDRNYWWISDEVITAVFAALYQCTSVQFIKLHRKFLFTHLIETWLDDVAGSAVFLNISYRKATRVVKKVRGIEICYQRIEKGVIHHLLVRCTNLTRIVFDNVSELNDTLLNELHRCVHLTSFSVMKCSSVTDVGIASALSWCTNLHLLALVDVDLSNATLTDLLHRNRLLRYLDVEKCRRISDEVLSSIKSCPLLRYLNVKDTAVSADAYAEWKRSVTVSSLVHIRPTVWCVSDYCGRCHLDDDECDVKEYEMPCYC